MTFYGLLGAIVRSNVCLFTGSKKKNNNEANFSHLFQGFYPDPPSGLTKTSHRVQVRSSDSHTQIRGKNAEA